MDEGGNSKMKFDIPYLEVQCHSQTDKIPKHLKKDFELLFTSIRVYETPNREIKLVQESSQVDGNDTNGRRLLN